MTNREAIIILKSLKKCYSIDYFDIDDNSAIDMAIKVLKQQELILDNIRAEIQKLRNCSCSNSDGIIDDVEDILDKYKAESE